MKSPSHSLQFLVINPLSAGLNDPAIHQALACVIDQEQLANRLNGQGLPLESYILPGETAWNNADASLPCKGLDDASRTEQAVQILKSAGYTWGQEPAANVAGQKLILPGGQAFPSISLLTRSSDETRSAAAAYIQHQARMLGIPLTAQSTSTEELNYSVLSSYRYDMALLGWRVSSYPGYLCDWFKDGNPFHYDDSQMKPLCDTLNMTNDLAAGQQQVFAIQSLLDRDLPFIPLYSGVTYDAYRNVTYPFDPGAGRLERSLWSARPGDARETLERVFKNLCKQQQEPADAQMRWSETPRHYKIYPQNVAGRPVFGPFPKKNRTYRNDHQTHFSIHRHVSLRLSPVRAAALPTRRYVQLLAGLGLYRGLYDHNQRVRHLLLRQRSRVDGTAQASRAGCGAVHAAEDCRDPRVCEPVWPVHHRWARSSVRLVAHAAGHRHGWRRARRGFILFVFPGVQGQQLRRWQHPGGRKPESRINRSLCDRQAPNVLGWNLFFAGIALGVGSWWALTLLLIAFPVLIIRILDEEKLLVKDLPGYSEYEQKVHYRLVPYLW